MGCFSAPEPRDGQILVVHPASQTVSEQPSLPRESASLSSTLPSGLPLRGPSKSIGEAAASEVAQRDLNREGDLRQRYKGNRPKRSFVGQATYYHDGLVGNFTACGDKYNLTDFTAAHRTLPFGTILRVVMLSTGKDVYVRVNDRGPFGRRKVVLDLSRAAAEHIGMLRAGVAKVRVEVIAFGDKKAGRCGWRKNSALSP